MMRDIFAGVGLVAVAYAVGYVIGYFLLGPALRVIR